MSNMNHLSYDNDWRFRPAAECAGRVQPDWFRRGSIYQIQLRSFTPEGTLASAAERLPWIASLGVNVVYLSPVTLADDDMDKRYWSPRQIRSGTSEPRNPYRVKDYYAVDPEYGTEADLHAFIDAAHGLGLKVLLDVVFYHCGPKAVFIAEHPDWIFRETDGGVPANLGWHFPPLRFANLGLCRYLWDNLDYWVREFDADGFRCDVADMVPLAFWETARSRLDAIKPDVILLAEASQPEDHVFAFDCAYCFPFFNQAMNPFLHGEISAIDLAKIHVRLRDERPASALMLRYFENHDIVTDQGTDRDEIVLGNDACEALLALCFTLDGTPFIFNGQEIADRGVLKMFEKSPLDWTQAETAVGQARTALVRELALLRRTCRALTDGPSFWDPVMEDFDNLLAFDREADDGTRANVFINYSKVPVSLACDGCDVSRKERKDRKVVRTVPALSRRAEISDGTLTLGPYGFAVFT